MNAYIDGLGAIIDLVNARLDETSKQRDSSLSSRLKNFSENTDIENPTAADFLFTEVNEDFRKVAKDLQQEIFDLVREGKEVPEELFEELKEVEKRKKTLRESAEDAEEIKRQSQQMQTTIDQLNNFAKALGGNGFLDFDYLNQLSTSDLY